MVGIYKITNPKGKIYIGQSINLERRKREYSKVKCKRQKQLYFSLQKYGWGSHKFEILEKCPSSMLDEKEKYWGDFYNVLEEGLNHRIGNGRGSVSRETKRKIGNSNSKPKPKGFGENLSKKTKGKPKPQGFGENLSKRTKGRKGVNIGMSWEWDVKKYHILQYDLKGNFIKEWRTISQASKITKIKGISECIRGATKTSGGFIWKKYSHNFPKQLPKDAIKYHTNTNYKKNHAPLKPILIYNQNLELLYEFPSIKEAAKVMGKSPGNISSALKGRKKNYLNLIWKYKN